MANNVTTANNSQASQLSGLLGKSSGGANKNEEMGKNEFLTLLVTQLKNQDPESPMDSKEFAVQLAQFTQVEKLISIDQRLSSQASATNSMAGYLGQRVLLDSETVQVKNRDGGSLLVDLPQAAGAVTIQLLDKDGKVVGEKPAGALGAGKHSVALTNLNVSEGQYSYKVKAVSRSGAEINARTAISGIVTGFIPGATPKLIVGGREVLMGDVKEVTLPS
jgi:flagellar basal-body rod modification protein FlgD